MSYTQQILQEIGETDIYEIATGRLTSELTPEIQLMREARERSISEKDKCRMAEKGVDMAHAIIQILYSDIDEKTKLPYAHLVSKTHINVGRDSSNYITDHITGLPSKYTGYEGGTIVIAEVPIPFRFYTPLDGEVDTDRGQHNFFLRGIEIFSNLRKIVTHIPQTAEVAQIEPTIIATSKENLLVRQVLDEKHRADSIFAFNNTVGIFPSRARLVTSYIVMTEAELQKTNLDLRRA